MKHVKVAWVNPVHGCAEKPQTDALRAWGPDPDRGWFNANTSKIDELIECVQAGDEVAVYRADLLAPVPATKSGETRSMVFDRTAKALIAKGVTLHELKTGRTSATAADLVEMMLDARNAIAGPSGRSGGRGRPAKEWASDDLKTIAAILYPRGGRTLGERLAKVQEFFPAFNQNDFYKLREKLETL